MKYIISNTFYQTHFINTFYQTHFIKHVSSNTFQQIHFAKHILSNTFYQFHFINFILPFSFYHFHITNSKFILPNTFYQFYFINFILSNTFNLSISFQKFILYTLDLISSKYNIITLKSLSFYHFPGDNFMNFMVLFMRYCGFIL